MKNAEFVQKFLDSLPLDKLPLESSDSIQFSDIKNREKDIYYVNIDYLNTIEKMKFLFTNEVK